MDKDAGYKPKKNKHPATAYALSVVNGTIGCRIGAWERLACERHLNDLKRQKSAGFPYVFDETRANRVYDWFQKVCRHVEGVFTGQTIRLMPHQFFDLGMIFGWVHKDTGYRRFQNVYKKVARGNAKSIEMSAICNYSMCGDYYYPPYKPQLRRKGGYPAVECAAVDREQARIVYDKAKIMAENSPEIMEFLTVRRTYVEHKELRGHMRALSKDTRNKNGLNPDLVVVDEWHEHPSRFIVDVCRSAFGKKPQNLMITITTAGVDAENNSCKEEEDAICKAILRGTITNETYFVIIRECDDGDDVHDFANLTKSNPILQAENAYSKRLREEIVSEHDTAYDSNIPDLIREYLTKRINWWAAGSEDKYFDEGLMDRFKGLAVSPKELRELIKGTQSWIGADLSKCEDLTAGIFVHDLGMGRIALSARGFIPGEAVRRHEKSDRVPYKSWADEGYCIATSGEVTDTKYLVKWLTEYHRENDLRCGEVAADPYNASQFLNDMENEGYQPVEVRQGKFSLSEATKLFRRLVMEGKVVHDGNRTLEWCISNAYQEQDSNENIKLSKKNAKDTQRIDLAAAVINALTRYVAHAAKPSVYEARGVRAV